MKRGRLFTSNSQFRLRVCLLIFFSLTAPAFCQDDGIAIHWTDIGITFVGRPSANLKHLGKQFDPVYEVPEEGRIIVRMPTKIDNHGKERDLTEAEWKIFTKALAGDLSRMIGEASGKGVKNFEIRTVEDINIAGYNDPERQQQVTRFTRAFLEALMTEKEMIAKNRPVTCDAALGSNAPSAGAKAMVALQSLGRNPIDSIVIYDGRATEKDAELLIRALNQKVSIINTSGDAPTSPRALLPGLDMVASFDCSKRLKEKYPGIRVFFSAETEDNSSIIRHVEMMQQKSKGLIKEVMGDGSFKRYGEMNGAALAKEASWTGKASGMGKPDKDKVSIPPPRAPQEKKRKKDDLYPPPFPPPGGGGGGGGAVTSTQAPASKEAVSGVDVGPRPESAGRGGGDIKKKILDSRPQKDAPSWPAK
ncbi:MAG: hypothetical protein ACYDG4_13125 [Desulfuromonadaceae bacterium]